MTRCGSDMATWPSVWRGSGSLRTRAATPATRGSYRTESPAMLGTRRSRSLTHGMGTSRLRRARRVLRLSRVGCRGCALTSSTSSSTGVGGLCGSGSSVRSSAWQEVSRRSGWMIAGSCSRSCSPLTTRRSTTLLGMLTAYQIDKVVHLLGERGEGLNWRRVEVLDKAGVRWCTRDRDTGTRFYRLGDILEAHAVHPRRGSGSGA